MGATLNEPLDAATWMAILTTRVLVVADVSAEVVHGGAERMLHHHIRALVQAGFQVSVLTRQPNPDAALETNLEHSSVIEYRLPFSGDKGYEGLKQLRLEAKKWWKKYQSEFDEIVAEQPFVMWALLKAGCALPRLQVCHSFAFEEYETRHALSSTWKHRLTTFAMRKLEKKVYKSASRLLVLSAFMQNRLLAFFGISFEKSVVVAGAAEQLEPFDEQSRDRLRQELAWKTPVVTTLRNLVPRTGVDLLMQVALIIKMKGIDMRWVLMGDGALLASMQNMAKALDVDDVITFTGFLSEAEVKERLFAADIFMVPTRGLEGFGLVTLEANACGLPVLATPIAANTELVPNIMFNQLADDASPAALAEKLMWMLEHPLNQQQRMDIQQDAHLKYNWDKHDAAFIQSVNILT